MENIKSIVINRIMNHNRMRGHIAWCVAVSSGEIDRHMNGEDCEAVLEAIGACLTVEGGNLYINTDSGVMNDLSSHPHNADYGSEAATMWREVLAGTGLHNESGSRDLEIITESY